MSDTPKQTPRSSKQQRRRAARRRIFTSGVTTFSVMFALLSWQLAHGSDPSLGHGYSKAAGAALPTKVVQPTQTVASSLTGAGDDGYSEADYFGQEEGGSASPKPSQAAAPRASSAPSTYSPPPVQSGTS